MKTLLRFLFFGACIGLLAACTESPELSDDLAGVELKSAAVNVPVHIVSPNGVDDTQNLKDTFALAVTQPGSVVQLVEGTYHLNFMEIREFCGTFRGAGKGVTVITLVDVLDIESMNAQKLLKHLIKFVGGDVTLSDMTIKTPLKSKWLEGLVNFSDFNSQYTSINGYVRAKVNNVEFSGQPKPGYNCNIGLVTEGDYTETKEGGWPGVHTDMTVTNCSFENFNYGLAVWGLSEGNIMIGKKGSGNVFRNCFTEGLSLWHDINMNLSVVGNILDNTYYGIYMNNAPYPATMALEPQTKASVCQFEHNTFNIIYSGMVLQDRRRALVSGENLPTLCEVKNNLFTLKEGNFTAIGAINLIGAVIRNNRITGTGKYGVRVLTNPSNGTIYNENGLMLGNNFSNSTFSITSVLLDKYSKNWTIVGGDLGETLMDNTNGAGNHLITGMNFNTADVPPGQTICDNLEEMRDAIKNW